MKKLFPADQALEGTHQAVGTLADAVLRPGTDGDIAFDTGAAAESIAGRSVGEIHLLNIAAGRKIASPFEHFHDTGAALAETSTVVEVVAALVGVDSGVEGGFPEVGPLNASDLLSFLLETDGGHDRFGVFNGP
jgi:hypothetical protein